MASFEESFVYLLILLLVGAGVTSQLIPRFTKKWEDRRKEREIEVENCRKELDIKVDITSKMAEAIAYQMDSASASISRKKKTLTDADKDAYYEVIREWYIGVNIISSKLQSYFFDRIIRNEWIRYVEVLLSFAEASLLYFIEAPSEEQKKTLKYHLDQLIEFSRPQVDYRDPSYYFTRFY